MAENKNKYVSPSKLSIFLENLRNVFSPLGHTHKISDITDYTIDLELSSTSNNPVANSVLDAEFDAVGNAMGALELAIDGKADYSHNHNDSYDSLGSAEDALTSSKEYTDNKVKSITFVGTYAEYQIAYADGQIPIGAIVVLTDDESSGGGTGGDNGGGTDEDNPSSSTTAMLGYAVLGQMVLG